ncbi:MAG: Flp pilus assembly protein CpaB [Dinoroseobacter sp.]|nr:Flp pilus assembly protein CpaB [Dinoroseobacter sp.]
MRLVFGLVLVLGIALAGGAMYMAKDRIGQYQAVLKNQQAALANQLTVTEVFVANRQIRYGDPITRADIRPIEWPEHAIPAGAFTDASLLFPEGVDELRTALRIMERDEPILAVKVTQPGEDAGVSHRLGKGLRAFAITVDVASGVSGFLRPGDRVDVYWTGDDGGRDGGITRLIEPGIQIIAVDQNDDEDRSRPTIARTVTVEAAPGQVAKLAQAQATGRLALALVGTRDDTVSDLVEVDRNDILGVEEEIADVRPEEPEVCTIRTRRGAEVVAIPIPCTN